MNENDIEARMNMVANFIEKEVQLKVAHLAKLEALKKKIKDR